MPMPAGKLNRRLRFEARAEVNDGAGNMVSGDWAHEFDAWANLSMLRGGESVLAARLESRQPAIVTIRNSRNARRVNSDWRIVDSRDGRIYNIRENPKESSDRADLEMLVEAGVAT